MGAVKVAVVGGGAAGCLAATLLARAGAEVVLLEKNARIGRKIYITGKGRCNLTADFPPREFLDKVVRGEKFLRSAVWSFPPEQTKRFFEELGVELVTERGGRVFPASQKSVTIIDALSRALAEAGVRLRLGAEVAGVSREVDGFEVALADGSRIKSDFLVIATGGRSYPSTGSTGDGYLFAEALGHSVVKTVPSLAALITEESVSDLKGLSLKNVRLTAKDAGGTLASEFGEMLFTDRGLSGPIALSVSARVNRASGVRLELDLKPALDREKLSARLLREFSERQNSDIGNAMRALLPARLELYLLARAGIKPDTKVNSVTRAQRGAIEALLKCLPFGLRSVAPFEEAVVTSGGVSTKELTPACMSRLVPGLYFVGEVIDADALTGGYNMQIAFSTAAAAARDICKHAGLA